MTGFKWELPMWCPKYGQVKRIAGPDADGDWQVWFRDEMQYTYSAEGRWYGGQLGDDRSLRNGIMPVIVASVTPQPDERYVTINKDGEVYCWSDRQSALADQTDCGGVIVDLVEAIRLGAIVQPPKEKTVWINIYPSGMTAMHDSRQEADEKSRTCNYRIACKEVTYTEGEGL